MSSPTPNRWLIAGMGAVLQVVLGTIYAWSYFQKPLMAYAGWNNQQVAWILSLAICFLGMAAAVGGILLPRVGPRPLAVTGALLYAAGWALGGLALASKSLTLLYLGLGVVGGIGLGLGYVTPVATAAVWFPDKKGLVTGMVVMGFGLGALVMSKVIGPLAIAAFSEVGGATAWPTVFFAMAAGLGTVGGIAASFLRNPAAPAGAGKQAATDTPAAGRCIRSGRFAVIWFVFFCNITAGIMFIGFQSPLLQDLLKAADPGLDATALAAAGGTLIAVSSLFNGIGRFFWGSLSDRLGRSTCFRLILASQVAVFVALTQVAHPYLFGALVCYVLLCYGGGFGTAPSLVLTVFGARTMGVVYGCLLTAWAAAGLVGPQIAAVAKDSFPTSPASAANLIFLVGAGFLAAGLLAAWHLDDRPFALTGAPSH